MSIALSFSRVDDYVRCPWKFFHKYISKTYPEEGESIALIKGKEVHSQLENWMKAALKDESLPDLSLVARNAVPILQNILANYHSISPENQLAINSKWEATDWFANDIYYRAIVDLMAFKGDNEAIVIDHKTGKVRGYEKGDYTQLGLTAAMLFSIYPQLEVVKCYYLFVEHKKTSGATFYREDLETLKAPFDKVYREVNEAEFFPPKVNEYCRYCKIKECELKR
jgi:CRISPR/Cas system-associated exonuclease Cas4 (RecB family)